MTSMSTPHRLNIIGKRLLAVSLVVILTCVIITVVLRPTDTSAQDWEQRPRPC